MTREWPDKFRRKLTDNKSASACPGSKKKLRTLWPKGDADQKAVQIIAPALKVVRALEPLITITRQSLIRPTR